MKHNYLYTILIGLLPFLVNGQNISNSGFENWKSNLIYDIPVGYFSTNSYITSLGYKPNVSKSKDSYSGDYAIKLETIQQDSGIYTANIILNFDQDNLGLGGIPYTDKPNSFTFYAKYDLKGIDSASIILLFNHEGIPIGTSFFFLTGKEDTYKFHSSVIDWYNPGLNPDSLSILIMNATNDIAATPGSYLLIDEMKFTDNVKAFPNGNFEQWDSLYHEEAADWTALKDVTGFKNESSVTKTEEAHEGNYALLLENIEVQDKAKGMITNGYIKDQELHGGMKLSSTPTKISGYYKYKPIGPDTAFAGIIRFRWNNGKKEILEETKIALPPTFMYTKFEIELNNIDSISGDSLNIYFASGNFLKNNMHVGLGSSLYLDKLSISYKTNSIYKPEQPNPCIYPNPSKGIIQINTSNNQAYELNIFDSNGQLKMRHRDIQNHNKVDVSMLPSGSYIVQLKNIHTEIFEKLIIL